MNSKKKGILFGGIAVVILAAVMIVLLVTQDKQPEQDTASSDPTASQSEVFALIEENIDDFDSLVITNSYGSYTIVPIGEQKYSISEISSYTQSDSLYLTAVTNFSALDATNKVLDQLEDPAKYGLDQPVATAMVTHGENVSTLYLGSKTSDSSGYYATLEGDPALYTVSSVIGDTMKRKAVFYVDKTLLPAFDTQDSSTYPNVTKLTLNLKGEEPLILEKYTGDTSDRFYMSTFLMTAPINSEINYNTDETIYSLFGMTAGSVQGFYDPTDAEKYGFNDPTAVFSLEYDGTVANFTVGAMLPEVDEEGNTNIGTSYYVLFNDNGLVYAVSEASLVLLDTTADSIISSSAILPNIKTVDRISLMLDGQQYEFQIQNEEVPAEDDSSEPSTETTGVTYNGEELDLDNFKKYYQLLIYPQIENINTAPATVPATVDLTFHFNDGNSSSMTIYELENRRIQIAIDGELKYEARAGYVDKLINEMEHLLTGEVIDTDW